MQELSIKIQNYKCFGKATGFDQIRRVNILIGKNNCGKSALLDLIASVARKTFRFDQSTWRHGQPPKVIFTATVTPDVIANTFPSNKSGGKINANHAEYGRKLIDREISWTKTSDSENSAEIISIDDADITPKLADTGRYSQILPLKMPIHLEGKKVRRVSAERDIVPEADNSSEARIQPNGDGITHAIQSFINRSDLPSELVESTLLNALNEIFENDASFTDIVCQYYQKNNLWEIFLEEEGKGRIPLSSSGSGLKTVITVLVVLFIAPKIDDASLGDYVLAFEELENNLHPALLRRLTNYIYRASVEHGFYYFMTTHSSVLIDQFGRQEDAQILHVTQKNGETCCIPTRTYVQNNGILDDLDVRASDLLQANGVIWVEGPSDRVYLNKWIELWSNCRLAEGTHYQIIFYGGRLLSHLTADSPDTVEQGISILNANRNAIILIDSDKTSKSKPINDTKKRIKGEFESHDSLCWITKGKEIENYMPPEVVDTFLGSSNSERVALYGSFFDHLDALNKGIGEQYKKRKSLLAEQLIRYMTKDNMQSMHDLDDKMNAVCSKIRDWNR